MADLSFPLITAAIGIPAVAAVAAFTNNARARMAGVAGAAGASLCALEVFREVSVAGSARLAEPWSLGLFTADSLNATFLLLYSLLTLAILILAPRRDTSAKITGSTLLVLAATLTAYGADNLIVLAAAWILSALPFIAGPFTGSWRPRAGLAASCMALVGAIALIVNADTEASNPRLVEQLLEAIPLAVIETGQHALQEVAAVERV
jgi:hypothetical protein